MITSEKATIVLDMIVQTTELLGEPFYAGNIPAALRQAIEHSKGGGLVAPMWLLTKKGFLHNEWHTANSEDHSGHGEFGGVKGNYVVTLHGGVDGNGILTPEIIETALHMHKSNKSRLTQVYAADLSQLSKKDVFGNLLQGGMPDGSTIPVYSIQQVIEGENQQHLRDFTRFAVVRTLEQAKQTIAGYESIDRLVNNAGKVTDSQVIAYTAGVAEGQNLIEQARNLESGKLGVWHPFNSDDFNPDKPQSRVLFLGGSGYDGLCGDDDLGNSARFVVVAPKARAAMEAKNAQILNSTIRNALDAGEGFMYNGHFYMPVTAKNGQLTNSK